VREDTAEPLGQIRHVLADAQVEDLRVADRIKVLDFQTVQHGTNMHMPAGIFNLFLSIIRFPVLFMPNESPSSSPGSDRP
jgi:hypothetical protein